MTSGVFDLHPSEGLPVCLTITTLDSTGGAQAQADVKTFTALGTYGVSVITGLVAQSFTRTLDEISIREGFVHEQLDAVDESLTISAVKVGACPTPGIIRIVGRWLRAHSHLPVVVDPVLVNKVGIPLQQPEVIYALREELLPRATVITPNRFEAAHLTDVEECLARDDMERAARKLFATYGCPTVVTGGGLENENIDVFCGMDGVSEFPAPLIGIDTKPFGAGDTYSAALTALMARGNCLRESMLAAKHYVRALIAQSPPIAKSPSPATPICHCLAVDSLAQADGVGISAHGTRSYRREHDGPDAGSR